MNSNIFVIYIAKDKSNLSVLFVIPTINIETRNVDTVKCFIPSRATISKSIKNICVWKNTNIHLHSYAQHRYRCLYDSTLWSAETLRSKNQALVPRLHSRTTVFILDARLLISVARACSHARCIVRNLQNVPSDVSIAILRRGQSCTTVTINSWRKLIQDNYRDEMLKHINFQWIYGA